MLRNVQTRYILIAIAKDGQHIVIPNTFELYSQACCFRSGILHGQVHLMDGDVKIPTENIVQVNVIWEQVTRVEIMNGGSTPPSDTIGF